MTSFWLNDPAVLFNKEQITEIWPSGANSLERRLNSITRMVILLGILGYLITRSIRIPISAAVTLVIIVIMYNIQKKKMKQHLKNTASQEGFGNPVTNHATNAAFYKKEKQHFTPPTKKNPLMNVSLPEIKYNPKRKTAAPSCNPQVEKEINEKAGNVGVDPRLFRDLGDKLDFENSMRQFHTNPNTKVPNDQEAFAKFCYGNMPSCKEGTALQCEKNNSRWVNY